jgi:uncharacterized membrane protein YdbT with pleckstrin-like domain
MIKSELVIPKVWRSEIKGITLFIFFSLLSIYLTNLFPGSVIEGPLFDVGKYTLFMTLPLYWFIPFITMMYSIIKIYDVRYTIDDHGVETRIGILSLHQRITRVRYEDIRSIEIKHSLIERILDIGNVEISTAATSGVEIVLSGVAAPEEIQFMLQRERDSRQKASMRVAARAKLNSEEENNLAETL